MSDREICGECKFHVHMSVDTDGIGLKCDWVCLNEDSDYYMDLTDYQDSCDCWEQRGVE